MEFLCGNDFMDSGIRLDIGTQGKAEQGKHVNIQMTKIK